MRKLKASELKLGNKIKLMLNDEDYEIITVDIEHLNYILNDSGVYEPIILEPEHLLLNGWNEDYSNKDFMIFSGLVRINYIPSKKYFYIDGMKNSKQIEFFHELQNLMSLLYNKEIRYE